MKDDRTSALISVFDDCSVATEDMVYFPVSKIGDVVRHALALRWEVIQLEAKIERLRESLAQFAAGGDK